ncbi:MAG: cell wall metabolism sensor histidine kinase WalK [Oscillospiraceae bacterium]|jgi:signal transduction histidine kinase|nr:cell wall metabolism sensor histidine kinase WalK [Oscillospiraceae bacterium]
MTASLRFKLVFIMLLLIVLLMAVVLVFLTRGVRDFYTDEFYRRMESVFSDADLMSELRKAADEPDASDRMYDILNVYAGRLGIDMGTRNFYILDGKTGAALASSAPGQPRIPAATRNVLRALTGQSAFGSGDNPSYMDIAVPVSGSDEQASFVVYIYDNRQTVLEQNAEIFKLILESVAIGFVISTAISVVLSRALLQPIRGMTKAAEAMAGGDFSRAISVESNDEIGILSETFNMMAARIESTLEDLKKAEALRKEFVANVSHELRTPLTGIRTYAETLADNVDLPRQTEDEFLRVILNESDRMANIVRDLLELSRFDAGSMKFSFDEFSMEQSIRDVYTAIELDARNRGYEMNIEVEPGIPTVWGDRARIEQVFMNVLTNAVKYTPPGGRVDISCESADGGVRVRISDTGIGIPAEDMPHVFDRFYRVDKARSRESGGTGLGLSIAREIVTRHGGEIKIESAPGAGTTVTVTLPAGAGWRGQAAAGALR